MSDPTTVVCSGACTVTHVLSLDPGMLTVEQVTDYMALWMAFVVAAVAILGAKAVYNRFRIDHGEH